MRQHQATSEPRNPKKRPPKREIGTGWIWGIHAAKAVLANPSRTIHKIMITESTFERLDLPDSAPPPSMVQPRQLERDFGPGHQGIAIKAAPLNWPRIEDIAALPGRGIILVLDQITDPHNVGAMLRLCSAFGVRALVMQSRHAPPMSGATAKVAVGCLETVPVCEVTNISNTLNNLKSGGWMVTGLAGEAGGSLKDVMEGIDRHVIVMGAEGPGLRDRVRQTCDQLAYIPMQSSDDPGEAESLNVATAAAIALYEARR